MFQKYTETARQVIFFARFEASGLGGSSINTEHLLLGLLRARPSAVASFLAGGKEIEALRQEVRGAASEKARLPTSAEMPLGDDAKVALIQANEESERLLHAEVNEYHLLLGLLHGEDSAAGRALRKFGVDPAEVRGRLMQKGEGGVYRPEGVVSSFYGIEIRLDWRDELQPTFVASYKEFRAGFSIHPVRLIHGTIPKRAASMIYEWAALHHDELLAAWEKAKTGQPPLSIPPLD